MQPPGCLCEDREADVGAQIRAVEKTSPIIHCSSLGTVPAAEFLNSTSQLSVWRQGAGKEPLGFAWCGSVGPYLHPSASGLHDLQRATVLFGSNGDVAHLAELLLGIE